MSGDQLNLDAIEAHLARGGRLHDALAPALVAEVRRLREECADAWDGGHKTRWRRGPDNCRCSAWSSGECACGEYGTGELLSLAQNPYR